MRARIFLKLLLAAVVIIAIATAILDWEVRRAWENSLRQQIATSLTEKVRMFAGRVGDAERPDLPDVVRSEAQAADARATVIDRSGKVLADSEANPDTMENHAKRTEMAAALSGHIGSESRRSHTLGIEFLYVAAPVKNGVVRLAYPLSAIQAVTGQVRGELLRASALALLISIILAALAAQSVARRLRRIMTFAEQVAAGDFSSRISDPAFDEIAQVASALDRTARQLEKTFSELETSRKQLETLLNSMQDAVVAVSKERHIAWANGEMQRLLPGLMLRQALVEAIRDPNVLTILDDSLTHKATLTTRATAIVPGRIFQATTAPMPDGGAVIVLHDHTEVERVEKTRRDFIANVSHELRTPLTSIQGYTETLFDLDPLSESQREFLEIIRKNAARMSRLTEDLLKLARVESGEWKLQKQSVRASDLVDEAIQNLRGLARQHGVDLAVGQASDATVLADRDAIVQVFSNLVENGVKYGGDGQKLELGSRVAEGNVEFYVRDFGPGIAAEHLPRLFERFYRVDKARSREAGGTGLGLAIVKHIVLNHGGTVRVESELHHGATFYFTLPMAAEAHLRPTTAAPA